METRRTDDLFVEALAQFVDEWWENGKKDEELIDGATELEAIALNPIPCWQRTSIVGSGLILTKNGTALIHEGYFVMLSDLIERLPRLDLDNG